MTSNVIFQLFVQPEIVAVADVEPKERKPKPWCYDGGRLAEVRISCDLQARARAQIRKWRKDRSLSWADHEIVARTRISKISSSVFSAEIDRIGIVEYLVMLQRYPGFGKCIALNGEPETWCQLPPIVEYDFGAIGL